MKTKGRTRWVSESVLGIYCLILFASPAMAKTLYQAQVEQAEISDKALQKSLKQMKDRTESNIINDLSVSPFHKRTVLPKTKKQSLCLTCHLPLPHRKNERSRTFINMHSRYIACETCHFRPKKIMLHYYWLAYDGANAGEVIEPRSGVEAIVQDERRHNTQFKNRELLTPQFGARIFPFYNDKLALLLSESSFALKIKKEWKEADKMRRAEIKAKLHAPLKKKGPTCKQCHGKQRSMLDLKALGATPTQLKAMQNSIIVRFFDRFKKEDDRIRINKLLR